MPFVRAGDLVVHYAVDGPPAAPVLLLGNSLGTNFQLWDDVVPPLARTFRIVRYDKRGHGLTDTGEGDAFTVEQLAGDAVQLLDALGIERAAYMGLSIGGLIGQALAAAYPARIEALVLCATANVIGPAATWDDRIAAIEAGGLGAISSAVMQRWFTPRTHSERPEVVRGFTNMLERTSLRGYIGCARAVRDADLRATDAKIRCSTLVVSAADDASTPPSAGEALRDAIPGARFVVIPDSAHIIAAEQPQALAREAFDFLHERARV